MCKRFQFLSLVLLLSAAATPASALKLPVVEDILGSTAELVTPDGLAAPTVEGDYEAGSLRLKSADYGSSHLEIPLDGSQELAVEAWFYLEDPVELGTRSRAPGLRLVFGSRILAIAFSPDRNTIQYFGTDGHNYGGPFWETNRWYGIRAKLYSDCAILDYVDAEGKSILNDKLVVHYKQNDKLPEWRGNGSLQLGFFNPEPQNDTERTLWIGDVSVESIGTKDTFHSSWEGRSVFTRDEAPEDLAMKIENLARDARYLTAQVIVDGVVIDTIDVGVVDPFGSVTLTPSLDPALLSPGTYELEVSAQWDDAPAEVQEIELTIVGERPDYVLDYLSWNDFESPEAIEEAANHGFNMSKTWSSEMRAPTVEQIEANFRYGLKYGCHFGSSTGYYKVETGSSHPSPFDPDYLNWVAERVPEDLAGVAHHPYFDYFLVNTEKKEGPIAMDADALADARERGYLGPDEDFPQGFREGDLPSLDTSHPSVEQPQSGLISADNLHYRTWLWWKEFGGYQPVHSALAKMIHERYPKMEMSVEFAARDADYLEFWFRTAGDGENDPVHYQGHMNDMIYSARRHGHKISSLFQFVSSENPISPDIFSESVWMILSQRPDRMGHWGASRAFVHPTPEPDPFAAQKARLKDLQENVIQPLYPMISKLDRPRHKTALLKSEATWLYQDSKADRYMQDWRSASYLKNRERALALAGIDWEPVHDWDVRSGALEDYDQLIVFYTDVLTDDVFAEIERFAENGGKVFADRMFRETFPAIPNVVPIEASFDYVDTFSRWWQTEHDDEIIARTRDAAYNLRETFLDAGVTPDAWSDSDSVVVNTLEKGEVKYIFVINDLREDATARSAGLPQDTTVFYKGNEDEVIYDITRKKLVAQETYDEDEGLCMMDLDLEPGEGRLLAVYPHRLTRVLAYAPGSVQKGETLPLTVFVGDSQGRAPGVQSVRVTIKDAEGNDVVEERYHPTERGYLALYPRIPKNLEGDHLTVEVHEITCRMGLTVKVKLAEAAE